MSKYTSWHVMVWITRSKVILLMAVMAFKKTWQGCSQFPDLPTLPASGIKSAQVLPPLFFWHRGDPLIWQWEWSPERSQSQFMTCFKETRWPTACKHNVMITSNPKYPGFRKSDLARLQPNSLYFPATIPRNPFASYRPFRLNMNRSSSLW